MFDLPILLGDFVGHLLFLVAYWKEQWKSRVFKHNGLINNRSLSKLFFPPSQNYLHYLTSRFKLSVQTLVIFWKGRLGLYFSFNPGTMFFISLYHKLIRWSKRSMSFMVFLTICQCWTRFCLLVLFFFNLRLWMVMICN